MYGDCHCSQKSGQRRDQIRDFRFSVPYDGTYGGKWSQLGRNYQRAGEKISFCNVQVTVRFMNSNLFKVCYNKPDDFLDI